MLGNVIYEPRKIIEEYFLIDDAKTGALVPFKFRPVQEAYYNELMKSYSEATGFDGLREIILKARKEGFTSLILAIFASLALQDDNPSRWLEISYKDDATKQHFSRYRTYLLSYFAKKRSMNIYDPELARMIFLVDKTNEQLVLAHNSAEFYVGSASTRTAERGGTVRGILFTESAHYPDTGIMRASEIIEGTRSMVSVGTGLVFEETTANGFNHFKRRWDMSVSGELNFRPRFFSWRDFYTDDEFKLLYSEATDKKVFRQEYPSTPVEAFLTSGNPFFAEESLIWYGKTIKSPLPYSSHGVIYEPNDRDLFRQFRPFRPGELIIVHADTAGGGGDDNFAHFFSKNHLDQVMVYQDNSTCVNMTNNLYRVLEKIAEFTGIKPYVSYERNNGGAFELERLNGLNRMDRYVMYKGAGFGQGDTTEGDKFGITMTGASRPGYLDATKSTVDERLFGIYDQVTIDQMNSFVKVKTNAMWKAQAEAGMHDDAIMSLCGICVMFHDPNIRPMKVDELLGGEEPVWATERPVWSRR